MSKKILDLGCGIAKVEGAIGVDSIPLEGVDVIADLREFPYPFRDSYFDEIYLLDVIEHIPDTIKVMEEVYRVAKPEARIFIRVVNWNSHYTAMDPTHVKAFTENSFDFFGKRKGRSYYTFARFDVVKVDYQYNFTAAKYLKSQRLMKFLSFYLSNILEGLNFELKAVKPDCILSNGEEPNNTFAVLRCPNCASGKKWKPGNDSGHLILMNNSWLVCDEPGCGRKYPVYDGLPVMIKEEGEQWKNTAIDMLPPLPSDGLKRIHVE